MLKSRTPYGIGGFVLNAADVTQWQEEFMAKNPLEREFSPDSDSDDEPGDWTIQLDPAGHMRDLYRQYCETKLEPPSVLNNTGITFFFVKYIWNSESDEEEAGFFMPVNGPVEREVNPPEPGEEGEEARQWLRSIGYEGRAVWAVTGVTPRLKVALTED